MSEFKNNFGGILLAYLNDTYYTLDNSQCNELTKLVQRLEDDNTALLARAEQAEAEAARLNKQIDAALAWVKLAEAERDQFKIALSDILDLADAHELYSPRAANRMADTALKALGLT